MNERDNVFFEEYKHLNKLCGDMYLVQNGVSEYIRTERFSLIFSNGYKRRARKSDGRIVACK